MALRAGYKGFKKLISPLILNRPGTIEIDGDALNAELNEVFFPRSEQGVLGAKNMLPKATVVNNSYGVTFTVNSDGTISADGTSTGDQAQASATFSVTQNMQVKVSGCNSGNSKVHIYPYDDTANSRPYADSTKTTKQSNNLYDGWDLSFYCEVGHTYRISCRVTTGGVVDNFKYYPMVRMASDPDSTFEPYAKSNYSLTGDVTELNGSASDQKTAINAIIAAATGAADFAAFKTAMGAITPVTRSAAPAATREVIEEEPVTVKKSTRKKSTATADAEKEGE